MTATTEIFHVMNRAARRYDCFLDDRDRTMFLGFVGEACETFDVSVLAYCLMDNHYHLMIEAPEGETWRFMKSISENYTRVFNKIHRYDGALFKGTYHKVAVVDDAQLAWTSRYIHRNVLEIGFKMHPYRWSSYAAYLGLRPPQSWLNPERVLSVGSGRVGYRQFAERDADSDKLSFASGTRLYPEVPAVEIQTAAFEPLDRAVWEITGASAADLVKSVRGKTNLPRLIAVLAATDGRIHNASEIAAHYGFGSSGAVRASVMRARKLLSADSNALAIYEATLAAIK